MDKIKQNVQYTFKYNKSMGRHGWLRLTPAYSVKMVEYILSTLTYKPECVLEPFSGTGTTELVCSNMGIKSIAYDINPFLVWLAKTKTTIYSPDIAARFKTTADAILANIEAYPLCEYPPIYNIERWWYKDQLEYLARLKTAIWTVEEIQIRDLLKIAFCRQVIALSNAAFNHVSTSFHDNEDDNSFTYLEGNIKFASFCDMIQNTITIQPQKSVRIEKQNSMYLPSETQECFDTIITSPPYPNRISYIRELRPYMYWLDYLKTSDDASNLDWKTIGGTWGAATSRLSTWERQTDLLPDYLLKITKKIAAADNKSSGLMANYVLKYFDDMVLHMQSAYNNMKAGGTVHYIVGNSNFYGNVVPSDRIYQDLLSKVGFHNEKAEIVRKRNCNKALYEYWISAEK